MKIILNNASVFKGGAEQVALSFVAECRKFPQHEYHVVLCGNLAAQINQQEYPDNFTFHLIDKRPAVNVLNFIRKMRWFERITAKIKPDCILGTGGHGYWTPRRIPIVGGFNIAHYIYPESPFLKAQPLWKRIRWSIHKQIDLFFFRRLDVLFVQTEDVKSRLARQLKGSNIYTISNTVHPAFIQDRHNSDSHFIKPDPRIKLLTVSAYYPHKNLNIIPGVLDCLQAKGRDDFVFVVTLRDEDFQRMFPAAYHDRILNVGPVPISRVPELYRECDFMFLPTLLECFSVSYAEAMLMGKPILTSDLGFARTVCKDAALYFDPMDADDIATKIVALASSRELREHLVAEGRNRVGDFGTSEDRAAQILRICEAAVMQKSAQ